MRILRSAGVTYAPRKLASYSQALAYFLLLEKELEESGHERAIQLWVQAFKDRDTFVSICLKELENTDSEISKMMEDTSCSSGCPTCTCFQSREAVVDKDKVPEKSWEDIEKIIIDLFDQMENFDESEVRKVVNFHNEPNKTEQNLSLSHTNSKCCFLKKSFETLGLPLNHPKILGPKNKVFVSKHSMVLAAEGGLQGRTNTKGVYCYQINIQHFSGELKQRILNHFEQEEVVPDASSIEPTQSQDFDDYHQNQDEQILYCKHCDHQAGSADDMKKHTDLEHSKCGFCKKVFVGEISLSHHINTDHSKTPCPICKDEIETNKLKVHLTSHKQKEGFKRALEDVGKIKNRATTEGKREKVDLRLAYKLFTEENKARSKVGLVICKLDK